MESVESVQYTVLTVTVRYFAAAKAAAGVDTERLDVPARVHVNVDDVLAVARDRHGAEFTRVLERCSFLLDEVAVRDRTHAVHAGATLDVLPPFAGG